jgi:hypothetical protein
MAAGGDGRRKRGRLRSALESFCLPSDLYRKVRSRSMLPLTCGPASTWRARAGDRRGRRMKGWTAEIASDRELSWW